MADSTVSCSPAHPPRAQRFAIHMPMRYRVTKETGWLEGQIENISRSGLLFRVQKPLEPHSAVVMSFTLPVAVQGEEAAEVICQGNIVRNVPPSGAESFPSLAATILSYRFRRGREVIFPDGGDLKIPPQEPYG